MKNKYTNNSMDIMQKFVESDKGKKFVGDFLIQQQNNYKNRRYRVNKLHNFLNTLSDIEIEHFLIRFLTWEHVVGNSNINKYSNLLQLMIDLMQLKGEDDINSSTNLSTLYREYRLIIYDLGHLQLSKLDNKILFTL